MTSRYTVKLKSAPTGHKIPALLAAFGNWVAKQPYGSVGFFDLGAAPVAGPYGDADFTQLKQDAWCFACLPDGAQLALLTAMKPAPVVLFGDEDETASIAPSLEAFLYALAAGKTGVADLDEDENSRRADLTAWLKTKKIKLPAAPKFDFKKYLSKTKPKTSKESADIKKFPPNIRALLQLIGRSSDDPTLAKELAKLKFKMPGKGVKLLNDKKRGISLTFSSTPGHPAYPSRKQLLYLTEISLSDAYHQPLPFKLDLGYNTFTIKKLLGAPTGELKAKYGGPVWEKPLDKDRGLYFSVSRGHFEVDATLRFFIKKTSVRG